MDNKTPSIGTKNIYKPQFHLARAIEELLNKKDEKYKTDKPRYVSNISANKSQSLTNERQNFTDDTYDLNTWRDAKFKSTLKYPTYTMQNFSHSISMNDTIYFFASKNIDNQRYFRNYSKI